MTVPLAALLGLSGTPGEVAAFGPVDADVTRDLIAAAGLHPATRWCVTVVSPDGQAIGHGCAHGRHQAPAFSPNGDTDPPSSGGSPPGGGAGPPGRGGGPGGNGTPRNGGGPGGGGPRGGPEGDGPATAAVPAAAVPAVVLKATVPATAAARPATAVHAVPGTGRGTQRQVRYHRVTPSMPRPGRSSSGWA